MVIDTVLKIGGSVTENRSINELKELGEIIYEAFQISNNFVIVPGGGIFAMLLKVWAGGERL